MSSSRAVADLHSGQGTSPKSPKPALARCLNIADLRALAERKLPGAVFDYLQGGAEDETTLTRNSADFAQYELLPRYLVDVAQVSLATQVLNTDIAMPIILAPTGLSRLFHHQGEAAVARAAQRADTLYTLSSMATQSIEEVAAETTGPKWFQIYVWRDRELLRDFIRRCKQNGYTGLCLTVDLPTAGQRERDLRNGFTVPPQIRPANVLNTLCHPAWLWHFLAGPPISLANVKQYVEADKNLFSVIDYTSSQFDPTVSWDDVAWMVEQWQGDFAIKGILSADDACRAAEVGVNAIIISNHGGRQLDHAVTPIGVLPEIVAAVGERLEVILDGGVRRGTDVIKALCLGARAVMIGRPYLYGLAAGGEAGVNRALDILAAEIRRSLTLLGCRSVRELDQRYIRERKH
ncbi:MAG: alpha-hydroxy acid oxidase [Gammaproteobacteria bacterium]